MVLMVGETVIIPETLAIQPEPTRCYNLQGEGKDRESNYLRRVENTASIYRGFQLKIDPHLNSSIALTV
jgi:hypothetical protein